MIHFVKIGVSMLDFLCTDVQLADCAAVLESRDDLDTLEEREQFMRDQYEVARVAIDTTQACPQRFLLPHALMTKLDVLLSECFPQFDVLFGSSHGTQYERTYASQYETYVQRVIGAIEEYAAAANVADDGEDYLPIIRQMPNKLHWLFETALYAPAAIVPDTPLPLLTPNLIVHISNVLNAIKLPLADVRVSLADRPPSLTLFDR